MNEYAPNEVHHADLFTLCDSLPDASVDMILCDLPYAVTQNGWDEIIPFAPMWSAFQRVIRRGGAIVLTATNPFSSKLVMSAMHLYRDEWIWHKSTASGFLNANRYPMRCHEHVLVFCDSAPPYYPQMGKGTPYRALTASKSTNYGKFDQIATVSSGERFPRTVIDFDNETGLHPTQKPVALFRYLIRTYTQPGELVLDPTAGSGTTALAAREESRQFICGDTSLEYVEVARKRLAAPFTLPMFTEATP